METKKMVLDAWKGTKKYIKTNNKSTVDLITATTGYVKDRNAQRKSENELGRLRVQREIQKHKKMVGVATDMGNLMGIMKEAGKSNRQRRKE